MTPALALGVGCALAVAGLLMADREGRLHLRAACKLGASACFVAVAVVLNAAATAHGRWLLAALALGALGDALLLSARSRAFLGGLVAFLAAHLALLGAFVAAGVDAHATAAAAVAAAGAGGLIARWLWPHLDRSWRVPVAAYLVTILAMAAAAAGVAAAHQCWPVAIGAWLFALSDIAVARDRFVAPGFVNRAWGLPAYYAAQLMLAGSLATLR